jgi:hypothetical protein
MAYNPDSLNCVNPRLGGGDDALKLQSATYHYRSVDVAATVIAAGFIDNGLDNGIKVGDLLVVLDQTTPLATTHIVSVVDAAGDVTAV